MMLPPIGFFSLPAYGPAEASGFDITWLVTTTAIPYWKIVSATERMISGSYYAHLVSKALKRAQKLAQVVLSRRKFATTTEIRSVQRRTRIDNQQTEPT